MKKRSPFRVDCRKSSKPAQHLSAVLAVTLLAAVLSACNDRSNAAKPAAFVAHRDRATAQPTSFGDADR